MVQDQLFGTGAKYGFDVFSPVANKSKIKVRKFWGLVPMFVEVTVEKLVAGGHLFNHFICKIKRCFTIFRIGKFSINFVLSPY